MISTFCAECSSVGFGQIAKIRNTMSPKVILVLLGLIGVGYSFAVEPAQDSKLLVCYYGSWAVYRPGQGQFDVEHIDPNICTHIIYGFTGLNLDGTLKILDEYNDSEDNFGRGAFRRFTNLKQQNPALKALLAIGGWNECEPLVGNTCEKYANMAATQASRRRFIDSVIPVMEQYNFDGFDLDWEYPTFRGGRPEDRANFALLCQEMRAEFDTRGWLLTAAVSAGEPTIVDAYDVPSISSSLHYIFLMAYDMHGGWESFTHHQAPMGIIPQDIETNGTWLNVKHAVDVWLTMGTPPSKLVLGMGAYGRGWLLRDAANNGFYADTTGLLPAGPYTREPGIWGYNEIKEKLAQGGWNVVRNPDVVGVYATNGLQWIGYDDEVSIGARVEYLNEKGLGGGMFWSIETDDFHGTHSSESFPLIKTARRALNGGVIPTAPPTTTTTTDPTAPTTVTTPRTTTPPDGMCHAPGIIADPDNCRIYHTCVPNGSGGYDKITTTCPAGTIFDPSIMSCNWYDDVPNKPPNCLPELRNVF